MIGTFAFAALFVVAVIALAAQHAYLTRRHEEEVDYLRDDLDAEVGKRYSAEAPLVKAERQHRDQETLLVVAAAEIERLQLGARAPKVAYLAERRAAR